MMDRRCQAKHFWKKRFGHDATYVGISVPGTRASRCIFAAPSLRSLRRLAIRPVVVMGGSGVSRDKARCVGLNLQLSEAAREIAFSSQSVPRST